MERDDGRWKCIDTFYTSLSMGILFIFFVNTLSCFFFCLSFCHCVFLDGGLILCYIDAMR